MMKNKWLTGLLGIVTFLGMLSIFALPSNAKEAIGVPQTLSADYTDRLIVRYRDPTTFRTQLSSELTNTASQYVGVPLTYMRPLASGAHVLKLQQNVSLEQAKILASRLQANPDVAFAEPDQVMQMALTPNDPLYVNQWHYKEFSTEPGGLNLPPAWDLTTGSATTVVAVIDTGLVAHTDIDSNILDTTGRVVPGYDFISVAFNANDGDGRDSNPSDPGDGVSANECSVGSPGSASSWHGTHVAGTIGALSNNSLGVAGVNWATRILPVRVLGKCGGFLSDIADGIYWAAGITVPGATVNANPAKVLNLSLGGSGLCSSSFQLAINAAVNAGASVVVAAGNSNSNASNFQPANCNNVITVAAVNRFGGKAYYSNFGTVVEVSAPGGAQNVINDPNGVLSTLNTGTTAPIASPAGDTYIYYQGTSMAAPHVAGVASLMLGVNPALTPAQVTSILQSTARVFPTGTGSDCTTTTCGSGIVNAAAAVQAATPSGPTVSITASPTTVASGGSATLTWSSTNASSCTASGAWSGTKPTSGSESTGALMTTSTFTLTCTGSGGSATQSATVTVAPLPTVSISANPSSVTSGNASTLTWSSTNATSCTASDAWSGTKPTSGSQSTGALTTTSTFTLTCSGAGGSVSRSAIVTVTAAAPTVTLTASPTTVASGGSSTLTWSSTNASSCTASGAWSGAKPTSGSESTGALTTTSTFTLTCTGTGGTAAQSATVTVAPAPTVSLSANPATVTSGGSSTLTWSSTNASSCAASGAWSGTKSTSGSESTGALTTTSTYTLTCEGTGGTASRSVTVTVTAPTNQPPIANAGPGQQVREKRIVTLNGSASSDPDGTIATFAWRQVSGPSVTLSSPNSAITRFRAPNIRRTTDLFFELTVTDNQGASSTDRVKVRVITDNDD